MAEQRRISLAQKEALERLFDMAALSLVPEEYTQREVFKRLMPKLYTMRKKGMSFKQITKLLNDAGFKLAIGSVRIYYNEHLTEMMVELEAHWMQAQEVMRQDGEDKGRRGAKAAPPPAAIPSDVVEESKVLRDNLTQQVSVASAEEARLKAQLFVQTAAKIDTPPPKTVLQAIAEGQSATAPGGLAPKIEKPAASAPKGADAAPGKVLSPSLPAESPTAPAARSGNEPGSGGGSISAPKNMPNSDAVMICHTKPQRGQVREADGLPDEVYGNDVLEHPAIPGLMLTKEQRFFTGRLQYTNMEGENVMEKGKETLARQQWKAPLKTAATRTGGDLQTLDRDAIKG